MGARRAVTNKLAIQYKKGSRAEKGAILDNLVELTGWNRGHARARLQSAGEVRVVRVRAPRAPLYSSRVVSALELCWRAGRQPAGKRLAPMLLVLVPLLRREGEVDLTDNEAELLMAMSAATIDRRLAGTKVSAGFRGVSHTKPGSLLKTQIPIRTWSEWDDVTPGFVEIDLVGHEGGNSFGEFCFTLTMTDIATGWTINRSVPNKSAIRVTEAIEQCCRQFPFPIKGIDSDNGSEFINADLLEWCTTRKITFTRSRPGNKNDGCHVEQKNWTHVRELVGYLRFDTEAELVVLNRIWALEKNYTNLVLTQQKLTTRTRVGAKVIKRHDTAQSPYERLVATGMLTPAKRAALRRTRNALRPAHHQGEIARLTTQLQRMALAKTGPPPRAINRAFNQRR
ncbi:MAG: integrase catalytic domain-containing protein [Acidimicrobiales bacterium]